MYIALHINLQRPPVGLMYALQKGSGTEYQCVQEQLSEGNDLFFELTAEIKGLRNTDALPDFKGQFVQGPVMGRFIYLDIGTYAGQKNAWGGRLKIPLRDITWDMIDLAGRQPEPALKTVVAGTGKNGGPNCATVKPFDGWHVSIQP